MPTICLALGSNVGDSSRHIAQAVELLQRQVAHLRQAPIYTSKAVGYTDQPDFLNTAVTGETKLSPDELLDFVKDIERQVGRIWRFRWGPREIDIDVIFYDDLVRVTKRLTIPHPRFAERDFVLRPLCDLNPHYVDPKSGQTVKFLLDSLSLTDLSIVPRVDAER